MSRVEPVRNRYVGHRYVPKIFGEWDRNNEYEGLSIVTHQGNSYTSKKRVPVGIDILNEEFWVVTGNYNAQIEYYRQDVERVGEDIETLRSDTEREIGNVRTYVNEQTEDTRDYVDDEILSAVEIVNDDLKSRSVNINDYKYLKNGDDWSIAIQQCIDDNPGRTVYVPNGVYQLEDTLHLKNNTSIYGENKEETIFEITQPEKYIMMVDNIGSKGVTIRDLQFKGTRSQTNNISALSIEENNEYVIVDNCKFVDCKGGAGVRFSHEVHSLMNGIYDYTKNCSVINCQFIDCYMGVEAFTAENLSILNNRVINMLWRGMRLLGCHGVNVDNNTIMGSGNVAEIGLMIEDFQGIEGTENPNANCRNIKVTNNTIGKVIRALIQVQNYSRDVIINGNYLITQTPDRPKIRVISHYKNSIIDSNNIIDNVPQPTIVNLSTNEIDHDTPHEYFKDYSLTYCRINGNENFPLSAGVVITDKVLGNEANIKQTFKSQRSTDEYVRTVDAANNWTTWKKYVTE